MTRRPIDVLKFGSSVLRSDDDLPKLVHEIYRSVRAGHRVVAVVSAIGSATDDLSRRADAWRCPEGDAARAQLLATGETTAASLLALAARSVGLDATLPAGGAPVIETQGPLDHATPVATNVAAIEAALANATVAVVPGFIGRDVTSGRTSLLGRGGSDLTAVVVAEALDAGRCILVKDVHGIHTADPTREPNAPWYESVTWETAATIGGGVVQPRAIDYAQQRGRPIEVRALAAPRGTRIGAGPSRLAAECGKRTRPRIALVGLGTVGLGVARRLLALDEHVELTSVVVRDPDRPRADDIPARLLRLDPALDDCDLLIDVSGAPDSGDRIASALDRGIDVVTADKTCLAERGVCLNRRAVAHGVQLLASAAAGGSTPILETVARLRGRVASVEGIVNGTANFVLDRLSSGSSLDAALDEARGAGLCESDASDDLAGRDAARKIELIARAAFGDEPVLWARHDVIDASHTSHRQVAWCRSDGEDIVAGIEVRAVDDLGPFAAVTGAGNLVEIVTTDGDVHVVRGTGAGRWPTAEAVVADVLDLVRTRNEPAREEVRA